MKLIFINISICIVLVVFIITACHKGNSMNEIDYSKDYVDSKEKILITAVMAGDTTAVKRLASEGVNLNAVGQYENTPMTTALKLGKKNIVRQLLGLGVKPNFRTPNGVAAAEVAVTFQKDPEYLRLLLDFGLDPNLKSENTPLIFFALTEGNWPQYEMLLNKGADINMKNSDGSSLVLGLVMGFEYERAKDLIMKGADFKSPNVNGLNVLYELVVSQKRFCENPNSPDCRKRAELLKLMRERGVEIPPGLPGMTE